jgi:hypothetical protein
MKLTKIKAILDPSHLRRYHHPLHLDHARVVRTSPAGKGSSEDAKRDRQPEHCGKVGTREQVDELCSLGSHDSTVPHAYPRIDRAVYLHVHQPGVRDLLPVLRSVSDHFPRAQLDLSLQRWRDWTGELSLPSSRRKHEGTCSLPCTLLTFYGQAFLPIGIGAAISSLIFLLYDSYLARAQARKASWSQVEEYRRLPLACIGGPLYVVSLFWIAWSAKADVHWIVPILSGITFGMGFLLIFMAMLNYLTDAYETFAASAQGIASTCRSLGGALLPLGSKSMFDALGIHWACSLLAFLSLGMAIIPFAFIKYGDRIRANSKFCQELKALKAQERKHEAEEEEGRRMSARNSVVHFQEDKGLEAGISKEEV